MLHRRRAMRLILASLVARHHQSPTEALLLEEIIAYGGPDERILAMAAANRAYVALNRLRDSGLRALLVTRDDGYLLEPSIVVERVEG